MEDKSEHFCRGQPSDVAVADASVDGIVDSGLRAIWEVASENIRAAYDVSRLPSDIALTAEWIRRRQQIASNQFIVAKTRVVQRIITDEQVEEFVNTETARIIAEEQPQPNEPYVGFNAAGSLLRTALAAFKLESPAANLRRQTLVLAWSAIEVAARDTFARLLNARPSLVRRLQEDERVAKRFQLRRLDLELFIEHGFDLTGKLGDVLLRQADVDSVVALREVFGALFLETPSARTSLATSDIYLLAQRRHLIVHHAARVTNEYLRVTGDKQVLGERLHLRVEDVDAALALAQRTVVALVVGGDAVLSATA